MYVQKGYFGALSMSYRSRTRKTLQELTFLTCSEIYFSIFSDKIAKNQYPTVNQLESHFCIEKVKITTGFCLFALGVCNYKELSTCGRHLTITFPFIKHFRRFSPTPDTTRSLVMICAHILGLSEF